MENNKKWYVFANSAEGNQLFMCDLSPEEFETVKRLLHSQDVDSGNVIYDEDYSGGMACIDDTGYDSKMEALKGLASKRHFGWTIDDNLLSDL